MADTRFTPIELNNQDRAKFIEVMQPFKQSGCRLTLPAFSYEQVYLFVASGHLFFAPSERTSLGFTFDPNFLNSQPPKIILRGSGGVPENVGDLAVHAGNNVYFSFFTHERAFPQKERTPTIMSGQKVYVLERELIQESGAFSYG